MFRIDGRAHGLVLGFAGDFHGAELALWRIELGRRLEQRSPPFGAIANARGWVRLDGDAQVELLEGMLLLKKHGLSRLALVTTDSMVLRQFHRLAEQAGIDMAQRHIDAASITDWRGGAVAWARHGIEPELFTRVRAWGTAGRRRPAKRHTAQIGHGHTHILRRAQRRFRGPGSRPEPACYPY
jgi:hypothetical protein